MKTDHLHPEEKRLVASVSRREVSIEANKQRCTQCKAGGYGLTAVYATLLAA